MTIPQPQVGAFNPITEKTTSHVVPTPKDVLIHQVFALQVDRAPTAVAAVFRDRQMTYIELETKASQLARRLTAMGVGRDILVGICVERSLEMLVGLLGILKAQGAYLPLDPASPPHRLKAILEDAQPLVTLTQTHLMHRLSSLAKRLLPLDTEREDSAAPDREPQGVMYADNLAYVMYTSGSTGEPNGVCITHRGVVKLVKNTDYASFAPDETFLQLAPLWFDASTFEVWGPLLNGGRLVIMPPSTPSLEEIGRVVRDNGVTTLWLTSALFRKMVDLNLESLQGLRQLLAGGDVVSLTHARRFLDQLPNVRLINAYGPTESTTFACCCAVNDSLQMGSSVPIGHPIKNTTVHVLNSALEPVGTGLAGELCIGGAGLARGYLGRPKLTAERFITAPFDPSLRLFRTGDLARYRPDGCLEFLGRLDRQVKVRGFRVELGEIEAALDQHPAVQECVVTTHNNDSGEKEITAYVVPNSEFLSRRGDPENLSEARVREWQKIYDQVIYQHLLEPADCSDATFNITGWNDSRNGLPLSEDMREQVDQTVQRILCQKPNRILEIGCGSGLLMFRLAPHCQRYAATDFSEKALSYSAAQLDPHDLSSSHITLLHRAADNFDGFLEAQFDAVIMNSVVQHFPSIEYLSKVLRNSVHVVKPGGFIFVGDVRSLPLLRAFHTFVQLYKAPPSLPVAELRQRIEEKVLAEEELVIAPEFFATLPEEIAGISTINVQLKRGRHHSELTRFRYDVMIGVGRVPERQPEVEWLHWQKSGMTIADLRRHLEEKRPPTLGIRGVPNTRLLSPLRALELLDGDELDGNVEQLREELSNGAPAVGVDPEEVWNCAETRAYQCGIRWSADEDACYDALLIKNGVFCSLETSASPERRCSGNRKNYSNNPMLRRQTAALIKELKADLKNKLPHYMLPTSIVPLASLPLTSNGKVDRRRLPSRRRHRREIGQPFLAPRNPVEAALAEVWQKVLDIEQVGINDNFFEIGGSSLAIAEVAAHVRRMFHVELSLVTLFETATIGALARFLVSNGAENSRSIMLTNHHRGEKRRLKVLEEMQAKMRASASCDPSALLGKLS